MKRYLPFAIVLVVALLAVGGGTWLYRTKSSFGGGAPQIKGKTAEQRGELAHTLGPANAPVTLEEFGDFQCPPCGTLSEPINKLQKEFHSSLRVIFREFPLANHAHAREAACAAEAAGLQGRFWEMHDMLFREQAVWSNSTDVRALLNTYAIYIGLDVGRFKADMDSDKVKERVEADQKQGTSIGVKNTPTIFLNNRALPPQDLNPANLRSEVAEAVKAAKPSS